MAQVTSPIINFLIVWQVLTHHYKQASVKWGHTISDRIPSSTGALLGKKKWFIHHPTELLQWPLYLSAGLKPRLRDMFVFVYNRIHYKKEYMSCLKRCVWSIFGLLWTSEMGRGWMRAGRRSRENTQTKENKENRLWYGPTREMPLMDLYLIKGIERGELQCICLR